jgi:hypothetical protein
MLKALMGAHHRRLTADQLRAAMGLDEADVNEPDQVVRDAAKQLRAALRRAAEAAGVRCKDPLPSLGKGADLTYLLAVP